MDTLTPPAPTTPAFDEARLIELIEQYSNPITTVRVETLDKPTVDIKGAHKALPRVISRLKLGINIYLYGPAGAGKTTLAVQCAEALSIPDLLTPLGIM